jgi:hypothetical protein
MKGQNINRSTDWKQQHRKPFILGAPALPEHLLTRQDSKCRGTVGAAKVVKAENFKLLLQLLPKQTVRVLSTSDGMT